MTLTIPDRDRRGTTTRRVLVSIGLVVIAFFAFSLSFDAQTLLAVSCGIDPSGAWRYPLTVDAAIVIVTLIAMWSEPDTARRIRAYLWAALGVWTVTSVLGNALHILTLPEGRVTADPIIAIAVNTVPAVTLFLTIHISTITVFRRPKAPVTSTRARRTSAAADGSSSTPPTPRRTPRTDQPPIDELMALADEGHSTAAIALEVGMSKSWVAQQIKDERERRTATSREALAS